jgi:hypothetical protein
VSELTERLDAIEERVNEAEAKRKCSRAHPDPIFAAGMMLAIQASSADVPFLLDLARKQQAAIDALLYVAEHNTADNATGRWWRAVIQGSIEQHMAAGRTRE